MLAARQVQAVDSAVRWTGRAAALGRIPPRHVAVLLSAYAAVLHNWVLPEHYLEWWGYGLYFLIATSAQAFCAGLLVFTLADSSPSAHIVLVVLVTDRQC